MLASEENLTTVTLENIGNIIDTKTLVNGLTEGSNLRLIGFDWTVADETELLAIKAKLDSLHGRNEQGLNVDTAQVYGTIHIDTVSGAITKQIRDRYPDITIDYKTLNCTVRFYNYDGTSVLQTKTSTNGAAVTYTGSTPTKPQSASHTFTFAKSWARYVDGVADPNALKNVTEDRDLYPVFTSQLRTFTVYFKNWDNSTLQTVNNVQYGASANYTGATPTNNSTGSTEDFEFIGWSPEPINIVADTICTAQFKDVSSVVTQYLRGTISSYESETNTYIRQNAFYGCQNLETIRAPIVSFGLSCFTNCSNLTLIDLTNENAINIGDTFSFVADTNLETLIIRSNEKCLSTSHFIGTPINARLGAVYVKDELVDIYNTDNSWNGFIIQPISNYPLSNYDTITDDWNTIIQNINNKNDDKYNIGDTKTLTFDGTQVQAILIGKQVDVLSSDNSGKARTTWKFNHVLPDTMKMNDTSTTAGGYINMSLYTYINECLNKFQPEIKNSIVEVIKPYYNYTSRSTLSTNESVWLFSAKEVGFSGTYCESDGIRYDYFNSDKRRKTTKRNGDQSSWWLRTAMSSTKFRGVSRFGNSDANNGGEPAIGSNSGVVIGFCIGK